MIELSGITRVSISGSGNSSNHLFRRDERAVLRLSATRFAAPAPEVFDIHPGTIFLNDNRSLARERVLQSQWDVLPASVGFEEICLKSVGSNSSSAVMP